MLSWEAIYGTTCHQWSIGNTQCHVNNKNRTVRNGLIAEQEAGICTRSYPDWPSYARTAIAFSELV